MQATACVRLYSFRQLRMHGSKQNKISQLEEIIRQSRQTSNYDSQASEARINQLESERDELLENSSQNLDQIRLLEDKIHKLEKKSCYQQKEGISGISSIFLHTERANAL